MEDNARGTVKNTSSQTISIILKDVKFKRVWAPGASIKVSLEVLREAVYDKGFKYFLDNGMLHVEEQAMRIELGLQEEGQPEKVRLLNSNQMLTLLKVNKLPKFVEALEELSQQQCISIADLAIKDRYIDIEKTEALKKACGIDVVKAIQLAVDTEKIQSKE